jgi:F-type H+-transporting ATPase subunit delta
MTDISNEYGTALFMLASELKQKKEFAAGLTVIRDVFEKVPEYEAFLASPSISLDKRLGAVEEAFAKSVPEHVLYYVQLLCEKGRISCFMESVEVYNALLAASERVSNVVVTSAVELTPSEQNQLKRKLEIMTKGQVLIQYAIDTSLLGGLIVEVDGKIMDGSLRHRLSEVKEVMKL